MYVLRLIGLFLIFPVFSLYAESLSGYSVELMGWALTGAYGLTQALLQIPFGIISDRFGRKPVIVAGLIVFALGSAVAAMSTSLWGVIIGRALQGAGAISAPLMALMADLTREEQRTKAMAVIGMTIGASFVVSVVVGPVLGSALGVPGIFWLTCIGALAALVVLLTAVPNPVSSTAAEREKGFGPFVRVLRDPQLWRLDIGIFVIHMIIAALFLVLPRILVEHVKLPVAQHWMLYLFVMLSGVVAMVPALSYSGRDGRARLTFVAGVAVLLAAEVLLAFTYQSPIWLVAGLVTFFTAFNLLEAMLPSFTSRLAPSKSKGAAIGVYTTAQFLGISAGGWLGAKVYDYGGVTAVFIFSAIGTGVWLLAALTAPGFKFLSTRSVRIGRCSAAESKHLARELLKIAGVSEAIVLADEGVVYLKIDAATLDESALQRCLPST